MHYNNKNETQRDVLARSEAADSVGEASVSDGEGIEKGKEGEKISKKALHGLSSAGREESSEKEKNEKTGNDPKTSETSSPP